MYYITLNNPARATFDNRHVGLTSPLPLRTKEKFTPSGHRNMAKQGSQTISNTLLEIIE